MPLLNPYLNKAANFSNGVNFAVAGSTALDTTTLLGMNVVSPVTRSSLSVQLDWFKSHLQATCGGGSECHHRVSDSLVLIETGGNDYNYALLQGKSLKDVRAMVPQVVNAITEATREVISLGVKRVFISGNFPIGCLPIYLPTFQTQNLDNYNDLNCLRDLNSFKSFQQNYYNFDLTKVCGTKEATVCDTPSQRVSWGWHSYDSTSLLTLGDVAVAQILQSTTQLGLNDSLFKA